MKIANWPSELGLYRIIQVNLGTVNRLVFSHDSDDHSRMLARVLEDSGITDYETFVSFRNPVAPVAKDPRERYELVGGGDATFSPMRRKAKVWGPAYEYNLDLDKQHLESIRKIFPYFELEEVQSPFHM